MQSERADFAPISAASRIPFGQESLRYLSVDFHHRSAD